MKPEFVILILSMTEMQMMNRSRQMHGLHRQITRLCHRQWNRAIPLQIQKQYVSLDQTCKKSQNTLNAWCVRISGRQESILAHIYIYTSHSANIVWPSFPTYVYKVSLLQKQLDLTKSCPFYYTLKNINQYLHMFIGLKVRHETTDLCFCSILIILNPDFDYCVKMYLQCVWIKDIVSISCHLVLQVSITPFYVLTCVLR